MQTHTYKSNQVLQIFFAVFLGCFSLYLFYYPNFIEENILFFIGYLFCWFHILFSVHKVTINDENDYISIHRLGRKKTIPLSSISMVTENRFYLVIKSNNGLFFIDNMFPGIKKIISQIKKYNQDITVEYTDIDYRAVSTIDIFLSKYNINPDTNPSKYFIIVMMFVLLLILFFTTPVLLDIYQILTY